MELSTLSYRGEDRSIYLDENCQNRLMGFRGNRGDTQGQPYDNERGRFLLMPIRRATGRYKGTKFYRVGKGQGSRIFPQYRLYLKESKALGEGRGNTFIVFPKKGRKEIAVEAGNSRVVLELQREL
jgi:hypothetical protein